MNKFILFFVLLIAACAEKPSAPAVRYAKIAVAELPGWNRDDLGDASAALRRSCPKNSAREAAWQIACLGLPQDGAALRAYLTANFDAWRVIEGANEEGLFTGYYEAELRGSRTKQGRYQTPVYGLPEDLLTADLGAFKPELKGQKITGRAEGKKFVPYPDRAAISGGTAKIDAPVLLWADDAADAFFLEVQGSGRAVMDDGSILRLGYAAQNGRPYAAIGRALKDQGLVQPPVTMESIRAWLAANPDRRDGIFNLNPSYVFFRLLDGEPVGAAGVELTPERSMAVDARYIPLGSLLWLDSEHPGGGRLQRLFVAQDTGGAIKGAIRGDVYWGYGARARALAGKMQSQGTFYLLLPKDVSPS